jgi:hypothetical protein
MSELGHKRRQMPARESSGLHDSGRARFRASLARHLICLALNENPRPGCLLPSNC